MGHAIFLGNSINRLNVNGPSWEKVMNEVVCKVGSPMHRLKDMPFPLAFDGLTLAAGRPTSESKENREKMHRTDVKSIVAEATKELEPNDFHKQVLGLGCPHVITTNYDYALERATTKVEPGQGIGINEGPNYKKHSLFRRRLVKSGHDGGREVRVWHIHGEVDEPRSLLLGHEHYVGTLERMRKYVKTGRSYHGRSCLFRKDGPHFDEKSGHHSWIDVFFRDDVHIIGFGMDYSEADIWWTIYYKQRLGNDGKKVGRTIFYRFDTGLSCEKDLAKYDLLKSLGVDVIPIQVPKTDSGSSDWKAAWGNLLSGVRRENASCQ